MVGCHYYPSCQWVTPAPAHHCPLASILLTYSTSHFHFLIKQIFLRNFSRPNRHVSMNKNKKWKLIAQKEENKHWKLFLGKYKENWSINYLLNKASPSHRHEHENLNVQKKSRLQIMHADEVMLSKPLADSSCAELLATLNMHIL